MKTRLPYAAAAFATVAIAFACSSNDPTEPAKPGSAAIRASENADVSGVTVTLVRVDNDSRCPSDVTCIWAGDATAVLTVKTPGMPAATLAQQFVHAGVDPRFVDVNGYRVHLDSLKPYPISTHTIAQSEYVAYVTVSSTTK